MRLEFLARYLVVVLLSMPSWAQNQGAKTRILVRGDLSGYPGLEILEDYGAFQLYSATSAALVSLPTQAKSEIRETPAFDTLFLDRFPFDTQRDRLRIDAEWLAPPTQLPALMLLQFYGPIRDSWLEEIRALGGIPIHYIRSNGYLVLADRFAREAIADLAIASSHLQYWQPYHPYFKLGEGVLERAKEDWPSTVSLVIQMVAHQGDLQTQTIIEQRNLQSRTKWQSLLNYRTMEGVFKVEDLGLLAGLPDVVWVGIKPEPTLLDEVQNQIVAGQLEPNATGPIGPGYLNQLNGWGFSQNPNDYPILDITDDGIGNGNLNSGDETLHLQGNIGLASRLVYLQNCTNASDAGSPRGHGHLNASIAAGYDTRSGSPFRDSDGYQRGLGVNPFLRIGGTRLFAPLLSLEYCGESYTGLLQKIVRTGARISNQSWGCEGCAPQYDLLSQAFDAGVRDADLELQGHQPLMLVIAAGNNGPGPGTVATPASGKNVLAVGASENRRPTWTDGCNLGPSDADNAMDIADISSRGPAPGGRAKPELVAPGTHIQGRASPHPDYTGNGICNKYHPPGQAIFAASSGTSHAAPAVAAFSTLVDYWIRQTPGHSGQAPSPAMLKAYLIAHAETYLTGVSANDSLPGQAQGYGMPSMDVAFDNTVPRVLMDQTHVFDHSGDSWKISGLVSQSGKPVRIALAYTDQPGMAGTSPQVNDLDLEVRVNGQRFLGNQFQGRWSKTGGMADSANNYEAVFLPPGTAGLVEIHVNAMQVSGDGIPGIGDLTDQDFALVAYNLQQIPDFSLGISPLFQSVCAGANTSFSVEIGRSLGFSDTVSLSTPGLPAGLSANFNASSVSPPGMVTLTIGGTASVVPGRYVIQVSASSSTGIKSREVLLDIFDQPPGQPILTHPTMNALDVPYLATLSWQSVPDAEHYLLEVSEDPDFSTLAFQTETDQTLLELPLALDTVTTYYWRVRGENACGMSAYSDVFSFTTNQPPAILLVDDDNNQPNVQAGYVNTLTGLNRDFDVWDVTAKGREPNHLEIVHYAMIVWFSGSAFGNRAGPNPTDGEPALRSWLDAGGCLFLTSQDYYFDFGITSLAENYLGVAEVINDATHQTIEGVAGSLFEGLGPYALSFPGNNFSDALVPNSEGIASFLGNDGIAAIHRKTSVQNTVFLAMPLEAVPTIPNRQAILNAFLNSCNGTCSGLAALSTHWAEWPLGATVLDLISCMNAYSLP